MQPTLQTARLILRPFHLSDAPVVQHLAGAPEVAATTLNVPHPYQDGMAEAWIKSHEKDFAARRQAVFAVAWRESNEFCGCIGLGILRFAFEELDLHRVYASHMTNNPASGRVMQKIGMMHEGCLREHYFKDGRFVTTEQYGILKSDWLNR
jgi:[ribosomal protein S5]-alanine N-acetyltransferase